MPWHWEKKFFFISLGAVYNAVHGFIVNLLGDPTSVPWDNLDNATKDKMSN